VDNNFDATILYICSVPQIHGKVDYDLIIVCIEAPFHYAMYSHMPLSLGLIRASINAQIILYRREMVVFNRATRLIGDFSRRYGYERDDHIAYHEDCMHIVRSRLVFIRVHEAVYRYHDPSYISTLEPQETED
jgi:hypothetical protein